MYRLVGALLMALTGARLTLAISCVQCLDGSGTPCNATREAEGTPCPPGSEICYSSVISLGGVNSSEKGCYNATSTFNPAIYPLPTLLSSNITNICAAAFNRLRCICKTDNCNRDTGTSADIGKSSPQVGSQQFQNLTFQPPPIAGTLNSSYPFPLPLGQFQNLTFQPLPITGTLNSSSLRPQPTAGMPLPEDVDLVSYAASYMAQLAQVAGETGTVGCVQCKDGTSVPCNGTQEPFPTACPTSTAICYSNTVSAAGVTNSEKGCLPEPDVKFPPPWLLSLQNPSSCLRSGASGVSRERCLCIYAGCNANSFF